MEPVNIKAAADRKQEIIHEKKAILYQYESRKILRADNKTLKTTKIEIGAMKTFMRMSWGENNSVAFQREATI